MLSVPVKDIVKDDYCIDYGTVVSATPVGREQTELVFKNGITATLSNFVELAVDQGGLINRATYSD